MNTSISPVGILGLISPASRALTDPSIRMQYYLRKNRAVGVTDELRHTIVIAQV
jgi:hypothetical protein